MPILYQTGYLTIGGTRDEAEERLYRLVFPNLEVRKAFSESLSTEFSGLDPLDHASLLTQMVAALRAGRRLTLVGAAFDAEMRNLSDRRIEVIV